MSRLNNDVVGAQNAISNTIVGIITNIIQAAAVLIVMLSLEWRLTITSILILPLFIIAARKMGNRLRDVARQGMDANAKLSAMMNETLNISGVLLVKLFGRANLETARFQERAKGSTGCRNPACGPWGFFLCHHRVVERDRNSIGVWIWRIPRDQSSIHNRDNRRIWRISDQPL